MPSAKQIEMLKQLRDEPYIGPSTATLDSLRFNYYVRREWPDHGDPVWKITPYGLGLLDRLEKREQYPRPVLGQRVRVKRIIRKVASRGQTLDQARKNANRLDDINAPLYTTWAPYSGEFNRAEGIYIGFRSVMEGRWAESTNWEDGDGSSYFDVHNRLEVWLVVVNERRNPIYALPEDVEFVLED